jgi:zinc transporter ZupT
MRLQNGPLSFVVNFLLGVAWASVLLGAVTSFLTFYQISIFLGIISAAMGAVPGMILVVVLEHVITAKERQLELQKQTALLEKLLKQKENNTPQ